ncbi:MAG: DUF4968 domain-containing protein, partial [Bacteroidales bacterium]|nr:DUF4968 domain-containing protein [Bacteroidales bacterium]
MKRLFVLMLTMLSALSVVGAATDKTDFSIAVDGQLVQVKWYTPSIVNIVKVVPDYNYCPLDLVVTADPMQQKISMKEDALFHIYSSNELVVKVNKQNGVVTFVSPSGQVLLQESAKASLKEMID